MDTTGFIYYLQVQRHSHKGWICIPCTLLNLGPSYFTITNPSFCWKTATYEWRTSSFPDKHLPLLSCRRSNISVTLIGAVNGLLFPSASGCIKDPCISLLLMESMERWYGSSLNLDGEFRTHLTLKADQPHSGWQPPYPRSVTPK